ncbi:hypothetical protein JRO89_XS04G0279000 [Xanthoceras sorbifolium]|uniref:F-box/LRR-repeat protein 15-like leucin rich repeat domain-containing protein n=1 Tax=Xanthoceras sorbifolium TaxID=99658 RepID=A0ABQ8I837_9ROSI|nr:hypothetical protein JRO89_XS04G0279000 [Xanthoceras sorbifolium]
MCWFTPPTIVIIASSLKAEDDICERRNALSELTNKNSKDLPQDCWGLIFKSLPDERHFESISLVSHRFLSITNNLRSSLNITHQTLPLLSKLFLRFKNLKRLDLSYFHGDPDAVLNLISLSELDLKSLNISNLKRFPRVGLRELGSKMKNLEELNCSKIRGLQDADLFAVSDCCLSLEALDISFPIYGIDDSTIVTDSGVVTLDFSILDCPLITQKAIGEAMRGLPNLVSVGLCDCESGIASIDSFIHRSFACAKGLSVIEFSKSSISDELLHCLANACLPLKKVVFSRCYDFSFVGLCFLLSKNRFLECLNLEGAGFLNDGSMIKLSQYLFRLKSINLDLCFKLTNLTFFTLLRECPVLSEIRMESTNLGVEESTTELVINSRIKSLHLALNEYLNDEFMKKVAFICPNLQLLDVSCCKIITKEGIGEILKSCGEIQCLRIESGTQIKSLGIKHFEVKKLEVLQVRASGIDDDALIMIANTCPRLLYLDLDLCINVTTRGVKEVVVKCRALRNIRLYFCPNVNANILLWMVIQRPSLRNIVYGLPSKEFPTESQRNLFLQHGCMVSGSPWKLVYYPR